jgi:inhibitor of KinA sporulation pathway (predicted exonuclease)
MSVPKIPDTEKLLIVDSEITCWSSNDKNLEKAEIIEIGAILVDKPSLIAIKEFRTFVKPVISSQLSGYCQQLTSIKQIDIDSAAPFPNALGNLLEFCGNTKKLTLSTWGLNERAQLIQDCVRHGIDFPFADIHFNIKELFVKILGVRKCPLNKAVEITNLKLDGPFHRALEDARYTLRILEHLAGLE